MPFWMRKKIVLRSMLDSFWDVLGFAGLHFGLRGLHVGSILCSRVQFRTHFGFQRHHWGPFNLILFVRKRLPLFRWYIFNQQTVRTSMIMCGWPWYFQAWSAAKPRPKCDCFFAETSESICSICLQRDHSSMYESFPPPTANTPRRI